MVHEGEYKDIKHVGCPLHGLGRRFPVIKLGAVFRGKNADQEWPHIGDQQAGSCMQTRSHHEVIQDQPGKKTNHQQAKPG